MTEPALAPPVVSAEPASSFRFRSLVLRTAIVLATLTPFVVAALVIAGIANASDPMAGT